MPSALPTPVLTVVVVSYNTREMTLACLASLRAETRTPHEVIVVDNASSDGSAEAIAAAFPGVHLMAETTNHGFARANILAAKRAEGEYLLLLNPDTVVLDGAVDKLLAFAGARPEARIWGGRTLYGDGRLNPTSCWRRMTLWNLVCRATGLTGIFPRWEVFNGEAYGGWQRDRVRAVDIVTGCFFMTRLDFWRELGGFDRAFFMYAEEADFCLRARAYGADPHITPEATIIHYVGAASRLQSDKVVQVLAGKVSLIDRHFRPWQRPLACGLLQLWPLSRAVGFTLLAPLGPRFTAGRDEWRTVWRRRADWRQGYPAAAPAPRKPKFGRGDRAAPRADGHPRGPRSHRSDKPPGQPNN